MSSNDLKKFDKDGNPLNLIPQADHRVQGNYYKKWLNDPSKVEPSEEDIKCELQLQALSSWEPLSFKIDQRQFNGELDLYKDKWVPYLRREGVSNDREGLLLVGLEGDSPSDSLSMPEARKRTGKKLKETDFTVPTQLYHDLKSLHEPLNYFSPLGRSMLVKTNAGGWFPPHKDWPMLNRDCFRVIAFLSPATASDAYEFIVDHQRMDIVPGRFYYVDTRKTHRTHSWIDDSIHLVLNVPKTWENVIKLMSVTKNY
jgi:hypothetical protein